MNESTFKKLQSLIVIGDHLAQEIVEKCPAVIYMGSVQFLTHKERVRIIQGNGPDYDIVPASYTGPEYEEHKSIRFLESWEYDEFAITTEWDGTKCPIHFEDCNDDRWAIHKDVFITYPDGLRHRVNRGYFRKLIGKKVDPLLHGPVFDPADVIKKAMDDALIAIHPSGPNVGDLEGWDQSISDDIPF